MTDPNPHRITIALDLAGLHGPEVDAALGVLEPTVDLWEAGTLIPTAEQLARLAVLTGYPVAFFHLEPVQQIGPAFLCSSRKPDRNTPRCQVIHPRAATPPPPETLF